MGSSPTPGTFASRVVRSLSPPPGLRTRIASTPSGFLHPGNGASFVLTWRLARMVEGDVLLRIDDLDAERARPAYIDDIFGTLRWLGITPPSGLTLAKPRTVKLADDRTEEWVARFQELRAAATLDA